MPDAEMSVESLAGALRESYPELEALHEAGDEPVYLVGGAVRDLLLGLLGDAGGERPGRRRGSGADIDVVIEGDPAELVAQLEGETLAEHERFATVEVELEGHRVDIAAARTETYPEPGALPVITPAVDIEADLARRDFTVNAMAVPLRGAPRLVDPHGGRADLEAGLLRVLHPRSFLDDPTRAIRAARYAARFGFELEPGTEELLRAADLGTVSEDRRQAELLRLAAEDTAPRGLELLAEWGLVQPREGGVELARRVVELLAAPPWSDFAPQGEALLAAALGTGEVELGAAKLARAEPRRPSEAVELAHGHDPVELVLARALGAGWLDRYLLEWRAVALEIDGADLLAAAVPEGPAVGRGLRAALNAKLDGEIEGRDQELALALRAANGS